jgi:hypothetical protein
LDRSARRPDAVEKREYDRFAVEITEPHRVAQDTVAGGAHHLEVGGGLTGLQHTRFLRGSACGGREEKSNTE